MMRMLRVWRWLQTAGAATAHGVGVLPSLLNRALPNIPG